MPTVETKIPNSAVSRAAFESVLSRCACTDEKHTENPADYETGKIELVLETRSQKNKSVDDGRLSVWPVIASTRSLLCSYPAVKKGRPR